jgi:hypothetical protein
MPEEETTSAIVERLHPTLATCRYKKGKTVCGKVVRENIEARWRLLGTERHAVLTVIPEDTTFDMSLLEEDHYTPAGPNDGTLLHAVVAQSDALAPIVELYFAMYPTPFASRVFQNEKEAMRWLDQQLRAMQESSSAR